MIIRIISRVIRGALNGALGAITADDATSDHLDRMDQIADAIKYQEVELVAHLIAQWPDDATQWQKQWLEAHKPKP